MLQVIAKKIFPIIILLLFGVLAGLAISEVISRMIYTQPWYESLVEQQIQNPPLLSTTVNNFGLRDRDYSSTKPSNVKRVLILGDSFTYGYGVADDAAVFPRLLDNQLNAEFRASGVTIEVLNGGIPGSHTKDWVNLLNQVKDSFQPDVILIVFFLRDGTNLSSIPSFFDPIRNEIVTENQKSWLYQNLYVYRLLKDSQDRSKISNQYAKDMNDSYLGTEQQTQEWVIAQKNLATINMIGATLHAKVGFVVYPVLVQLDDTYPFKDSEQLVANYGINNKMPTLDLFPAFKGKNPPDLWVSPYNQHPNARGHQIAAEAILPFLRQLLTDN